MARPYTTSEFINKALLVHDGEVRPDYSYTKNGRRFHKSGFRKAGIRSRLPEFYDENLTEREMMENAGFARIWDCGKDRWVYSKATTYNG